MDAGYWLFVTASVGLTTSSDLANGNTDAYTSPIFAVVGGEDVNVDSKKDVPNVTKAVKDDNNGSFVDSSKVVPEGSSRDVFTAPNRVADSASDQLIEYQLAGTVASNINSYKEYSYTFTDDLPSTMVPELVDGKPVVEVKIGDKTVKPEYQMCGTTLPRTSLLFLLTTLRKKLNPTRMRLLPLAVAPKSM